MQEFSKFFFGEIDPAAPIEHDVAVDVGPEGESDFPDIVFFQNAFFHLTGEHVGNGIEGRRASRAKIPRKFASVGPHARENVVKNARLRKGIVDIAFHHSDKAVLERAFQRVRQNMRKKLRKFVISDTVQEGFPIGEVMIDRHRRDAYGLSHTPHAYGFRAFLFENRERNAGDSFCGMVLRHLYSVYHTAYRRKAFF